MKIIINHRKFLKNIRTEIWKYLDGIQFFFTNNLAFIRRGIQILNFRLLRKCQTKCSKAIFVCYLLLFGQHRVSIVFIFQFDDTAKEMFTITTLKDKEMSPLVRFSVSTGVIHDTSIFPTHIAYTNFFKGIYFLCSAFHLINAITEFSVNSVSYSIVWIFSVYLSYFLKKKKVKQIFLSCSY